MDIQFGSGVIFGIPVAGNTPTNPTPFRWGVVQEATVDFKGDLKKLFSQFQFPVATARGKIEVGFKAKLAVFDVQMLNQLYFAQDIEAGVTLVADQEKNTVNSTTVTVTHSGAFAKDFGVQYANGQQFIKVSSPTQAGEYSVNVSTGVYTFDSDDNGEAVLTSYTYTDANRGSTINISQQLMGYAPEVEILLYNMFRGKFLALKLFDVTLGGISIPTKLEDFWIADIDGSANADASGNVAQLMADNV